MCMKPWRSISVKVVSIIFLLSFIFISSLTYMNIQEQKIFFEKAYKDKAVIIARSLDAGIESRRDLDDRDKLQTQIYKLIWENPELLRINVNLPDNDVLKVAVSNDANAINTQSSPDSYKSYEKDVVVHAINRLGNTQTLTVIVPIHLFGQRVGTYDILFSMDSVDETIALQTERLIGIAIVDFLAFLFLFLFLINYSVIRPIKELGRGIEAIRSNNLEYKICVGSNDELGDLASAFNQMSSDLKKSRKELENYNTDLEKKVLGRTRELQARVDELERFHKLTVGRELKMIELKKRIEELEGGK